ncbi:dihydropteridine reductase-like protein [Umbelopsis sp. PMI_123]|nr:dihydropteridine reductase-like protein [Umbelopsis sp. PMI_123]
MSNVIVYGGAGALGRHLVSRFAANNWTVTNIDLVKNDDAKHNILLNIDASLEEQSKAALEGVSNALGSGKADAVLCVAGGWAGGNANSADFIKNSDLMIKQSVNSSLIAANVAAHHLASNGLLTLTGALAAEQGTPGMIGYGIAKAAVHQLVKSLAANDSGLPSGAVVTAILPVTLDTPMNRKFAAANTDFSTWTPLDDVSNYLLQLASKTTKITSGKLLSVITEKGQTTFKEL